MTTDPSSDVVERVTAEILDAVRWEILTATVSVDDLRHLTATIERLSAELERVNAGRDADMLAYAEAAYDAGFKCAIEAVNSRTLSASHAADWFEQNPPKVAALSNTAENG